MKACNQIWRLVPNKMKRYPGGRELDRFRRIEPAVDDECPEAWVGSDTVSCYREEDDDPNMGCARCILPSGEEKYLFEAIHEDPEGVLGKAHMQLHGERVGVLVKLLDAQKQLNLQTHPSKAYAKQFYHSEYGKEESWYVIGLRSDTEEPPYVLMGFADPDAKEKFSHGFDVYDPALMEGCCHKIQIREGDLFFIGAGLPHAIGPGCFLLEVQEPSDITVVPFKPHGEHLQDEELKAYKDKTLGCFDYTARNAEENLAFCAVKPEVVRSGSWGVEEMMIGPRQTSAFSYTRLEAKEEVTLRKTGALQIAIVLKGSATLRCGQQVLEVKQADELFFPYAIEPVVLIPHEPVTMVLCNPGGVNMEAGDNR